MSTKHPFRTVLYYDPAIDPTRTDLAKYTETRDPAGLTYFEGERPTVFVCRVLTSSECDEVGNMASAHDKFKGCFRRGLMKVENLAHDGGDRRDWVRPDDLSGKQKIIPITALEGYFDEAMIQEIGMTIYVRSFLARTSGAFYPLLDTSQHALMATMHHRAARMSASLSAAESKSEPSQPQSGEMPST